MPAEITERKLRGPLPSGHNEAVASTFNTNLVELA